MDLNFLEGLLIFSNIENLQKYSRLLTIVIKIRQNKDKLLNYIKILRTEMQVISLFDMID